MAMVNKSGGNKTTKLTECGSECWDKGSSEEKPAILLGRIKKPIIKLPISRSIKATNVDFSHLFI
jgi:hypothetical protein